MQTLGQKIYHLRKQSGLSQEELGNIVGVSRQAVSKWELDALRPKAKALQRLCCYFHVDSTYFLGEEGDIGFVKQSVQTFGDQICALRKKAGLSQEKLAEKLDVSRQTVSLWETNVLRPKSTTLQTICTYFQVDPSELLSADVPAEAKAEGEVPCFVPQTVILVEDRTEEAACAEDRLPEWRLAEKEVETKRKKPLHFWIAVAALSVAMAMLVFVLVVAIMLLSGMLAGAQKGDQEVQVVIIGFPTLDLVVITIAIGGLLLVSCIIAFIYILKRKKGRGKQLKADKF